MCLIIHKPAGERIPEDLLRAGASLNHDGWGLMGFDTNGKPLVERRSELNIEELLATERSLRGAEYALHLRRRTRGDTSEFNAHPFRVTDDIYLMHNGTLGLETATPGRSDTWHLVHRYLRPLEKRWPGLLRDSTLHALLQIALPPENRVVLMLTRAKRLVILNRHHGVEFEGLWLSNARWIDRRLLPLDGIAAPQERSFDVEELRFL
ncbi:MAG TPA: hypothetical protein VNJ47_04335 [Nevskiales bacterium]|nr:hypothetical protein [Nevskiales bacterium]